MRGNHDIPQTSLRIEFDHNRDDYRGGHGLHCHVADRHGRIASINLETLTIMAGSLNGKEGRKAMEWIRANIYTLREEAEYWSKNGAVWQ